MRCEIIKITKSESVSVCAHACPHVCDEGKILFNLTPVY
jgi:hypothetical protein